VAHARAQAAQAASCREELGARIGRALLEGLQRFAAAVEHGKSLA
jgi:hypothetical protein